MVTIKYLGNFQWAIFVEEKALTSPIILCTLIEVEDYVRNWTSSFPSTVRYRIDSGTFLEDLNNDNIFRINP